MAKIDALTGNECVAEAVKLCRPQIIAAYPITPQTSVVEKLAGMISNNLLAAEMINVESEHSAMSVLKGAAMVGQRLFTATAGQGLALMYEPYFAMATARFPMVMAITCRDMMSPSTIWSGLQDAISVRDAGWIQIFVENNQEILDMIIQGYRISENPEVFIPVNICYDGFYLSHQTERVLIPEQAEIDSFLHPFTGNQLLDVNNPQSVDSIISGRLFMDYRESHLRGMKKALEVIDEVDSEFNRQFGRSHGGLVETYRIEDADEVLITIGAMTGAAREAVDIMRGKGLNIGLLKVRSLRPFPREKIANLLSGRKSVGVVDKSVSFGWRTGVLYQEVLSAMGWSQSQIPSVAFIGGLGGYDISIEHMIRAIEVTCEVGRKGQTSEQTIWLK